MTESVALLLAPAAFSLGVAAIVIWSDSGHRAFLLGALAVLVPTPLVVRALQKRFDPFEPIVLLVAALFVMFVVRPAAHLFYHDVTYDGRSIQQGFDRGLLIGLVGVAAVYLGYFAPIARSLARGIRPLPSTFRPAGAIGFSVFLVILGAVLYAFYIREIGGLTAAKGLLSGRDIYRDFFASNATVYFLYGPYLAIPAALLLLEAAAERRGALMVVGSALVIIIAVVSISGPRGDRIWLMPLALGVFALPYLRAQKRPGTRTILVVAVLTFAIGITFLREVRIPSQRPASPGTLFVKAVKNPLRGWHDFVLGPDTEMFSVVAAMAERVPSTQPHEPGLTLESLVLHWVPRKLYASKPAPPDDKIYALLRPDQYKISRLGPVPSLFGGFYYDSGLLGVAIGSILVGILVRLLFEYLVAHPANAGVRLLYVSALPLVVILIRGNLNDTVGRMSYLVFPILVALWWAGRRGQERAKGDLSTTHSAIAMRGSELR